MTLTDDPPVGEVARPLLGRARPYARSIAAWDGFVPLALGVAAAGGALTIGAAYARATTSNGDSTHYALFWTGVTMFMVPAAIFLCRAATSRSGRIGTLIGIALFLYVPKLLRDPFGPLYHDELAHWRQVQDISTSGHLFVDNSIIPIVRDYPGLHIVAVTIKSATGLSAWGAAIAVLLFAHCLAVLAVYLLVEGIHGRSRIAGIAALFYALNASFMYFHTMFAYESLGIGLFFVTLLAMQRMEAAASVGERRAWTATAICLIATLVTTHHLSSVFLAFVLVVWGVFAVWRAKRVATRDGWSVARYSVLVVMSSIAIVSVWFFVVAPTTFGYLSPYLGNGSRQLLSLLGGSNSQTRQPFVHSTEPFWERLAGLAAPLMVVAATVAGLLLWRRGARRGVAISTLVLLGLGYFPSIPFVLSESGAEGARRSWAFSYAGIALLVAPCVCILLERAHRLAPRPRMTAWFCLLALFVTLMMGNVADGQNEYYRFPGPYAFGSDTRSMTPELIAMSDWFLHEIGPNKKLISDRYSSLALAAFGRQDMGAPAKGFPAYDLWFQDKRPSDFLLGELSSSNFQYLVIDKRTATDTPVIGVYFEPDEPLDSTATRSLPISQASLDKFTRFPWTAKVYESNDYVVYRFQFDSLDKTVAGDQR